MLVSGHAAPSKKEAAKAPSKPLTEEELRAEYTRSVDMLRRTRTLLAEEKKRWKRLHADPVPDSLSVSEKDGNIIIEMTIDPAVRNAINSLPLHRTITLEPEKRNPRFLEGFVCASFTTGCGWRPAIGIGIPIQTWIQRLDMINVGAYTTFLSAGLDLYYRIGRHAPEMGGLSVHLMGGTTWEGKPSVGGGIGVTF